MTLLNEVQSEGSPSSPSSLSSSWLNGTRTMNTCLLLALVAISINLGNGMPPIGRDYNLHCHCVKLESRVIPPDSLRSIEIRPRGPHCQTIEVIAGLAKGEKICLDPNTPWVKRLTRFVVEKQMRRG